MAEFRKDPIVGQWVIVHTDNSWGPDRYAVEDHTPRDRATCQFCPGREHMTPPELDAVRSNGEHSEWKLRVVPNKFPALKIEGTIDARKSGIFDYSNGVGAHEVVIETPDHNKQLADLSLDEIKWVIDKYQSRLVDLTGDKRFKYIIIFKNYGDSAGATIEHSHTQIIALPMIPKYVVEELEGTRRYFEQNQRCVFCDMLAQESKDEDRIVIQNDEFVAFCPFVPRYPFETWILPKNHSSEFASLSDSGKINLAAILKNLLLKMRKCLHDPAYNFYLHVAPINYEGQQSFHWHIEFVPKLTNPSGFEWGTGFYTVRTAPHAAARFLREAN
ncbi:MAG: galactose-1-phosphate uridylyltransferase [Candidatus Omnitrophota bacterium]|nr:galactose-1-phosphate uridylyltransferase [Candidatus Omnitrophota bacterium]